MIDLTTSVELFTTEQYLSGVIVSGVGMFLCGLVIGVVLCSFMIGRKSDRFRDARIYRA